MPSSERKRYLNVAKQWAVRNQYQPCNVTVCGAVIDAGPSEVSVFITGNGDRNPSAMVTFSRPDLTVLRQQFFEVGCPNGVFPPSQGG
jgi:hypothetical protein